MYLNTVYLERCIQTLEGSIALLQQCEPESIEYDIFRNAVIKGFELTLETAGKLLRKAIRQFLASNKAADRLIFKDIFRLGAKHGLLTVDEVSRWFEYRDNRNTTVHDYGEKFAEETLQLLPQLIADAKQLHKQINNACKT